MSAPPSGERKVQATAEAAREKKAADLQALDVRGLSSVTDYFVVLSGRSTTHLRTLVDGIREGLRAAGARPLHQEGTPESGWVLLDYGDVLVHVFLEETRAYYALERLWGDAPTVPVEGA